MSAAAAQPHNTETVQDALEAVVRMERGAMAAMARLSRNPEGCAAISELVHFARQLWDVRQGLEAEAERELSLAAVYSAGREAGARRRPGIALVAPPADGAQRLTATPASA
jgi:hypothetical protein